MPQLHPTQRSPPEPSLPESSLKSPQPEQQRNPQEVPSWAAEAVRQEARVLFNWRKAAGMARQETVAHLKIPAIQSSSAITRLQDGTPVRNQGLISNRQHSKQSKPWRSQSFFFSEQSPTPTSRRSLPSHRRCYLFMEQRLPLASQLPPLLSRRCVRGSLFRFAFPQYFS